MDDKIKHLYVLIDLALKFIQTELNAYLNIKIESGNVGQVLLRPLIKQDGTLDMEDNSLSLVLVNIDEEHAAKNSRAFFKNDDNKIVYVKPAINLNLAVLFAANFTNYDEALKFLSLVITFFQHKNLFNPENSPGFNVTGVKELNTKLLTLNFEQQNHLWGTLGAKYMPSVMIKLSLLSVQETGFSKEVEPIRSVENNPSRIN